MNLADQIANPSELNRDSLHELRQLVARYPYFQAARLLLVQNLFLLHDADFGEELRRAALLLPDRSVLFRMVEGDSYKPGDDIRARTGADTPDRLDVLIDRFIQSVPETARDQATPQRKATPVDAATDYTFFLEEMDDAPVQEEQGTPDGTHREELVEEYIAAPQPIQLQEEPQYTPDIPEEIVAAEDETPQGDDGFLTETLAKIYIKQGRYDKALEILYRINLNFPEKSNYFADQIRFLRKLVVNEKYAESTQPNDR